MARTTNSAQDAGLAALDRQTHVRVKYEDADGTMQTIHDLQGTDYFDSLEIEADADHPISSATFEFWRSSGERSLAPLIEASEINRDSGGSYAPALAPVREITVEVATMLPGETAAPSDWVLIWEGEIDSLDWSDARITVECLDPITTLNRHIIQTISTYGDDGGSKNIDTVMQDILDAEFGAATWPLTVVGTPTQPIAEYELGNVSVLEALMALADIIGWSLHWLWDSANSEFRLTFYEPDRTNTTASYTFGPDDYYVVSRMGTGVRGIRNDGEVLYTDASGNQQSVSDTRTASVTKFGNGFIRIDAQGSSIVNATQANNYLAAVLDDTEDPKIEQGIEAAFHWPIEIGDVHTYSANDVHYDTDQTWAAFGYRHIITSDRMRTVISAAGKPSGGFRRWLDKDVTSREDVTAPSVSVEQSQSGATGTVALDIDDPSNRVTATAFEPSAGAGDFDLTSDPTGWAVYDNTSPFTLSDTVTITAKHTSRIGWAVRYRTRTGVEVWKRGVVSFDLNEIAEVTNITVDFNADGEAVVSATGDEDTANMYVTVGDGSAPSDPTAGVNDGSISGRNGTVDTGVKITTGNEAFVKVIAADSGATVGPVQAARQARRIGPFHKDTGSRITFGTGEDTLETIAVPAGVLGTDGLLRLTMRISFSGTAGTKTIRIKFGSTTLFTYVAAAGDTGDAKFDLLLFNNASASAQRSLLSVLLHQGAVTVLSQVSSEDTTLSVNLVVTGECSVGTDVATLSISLAELQGTN